MRTEEVIDQLNTAYANYCDAVEEFCDYANNKSKWLRHYLNSHVKEAFFDIHILYNANGTYAQLQEFKKRYKGNCTVIEENMDRILSDNASAEANEYYMNVMDKKQEVLSEIEDAFLLYGALARQERLMCRQ